jgi:hypothetical protein
LRRFGSLDARMPAPVIDRDHKTVMIQQLF